MEFNLTSKVPIYLQIEQQLKTYINCGVLAPDERLPSVRDLAGQLSINPNTIMRVYTDLENEKIIYSLNKKGYYVSPRRTDMKKERLAQVKEELKEAVKSGISLDEIESLLKEVEEENRKEGKKHD